mgnify:CR=1 FL=1
MIITRQDSIPKQRAKMRYFALRSKYSPSDKKWYFVTQPVEKKVWSTGNEAVNSCVSVHPYHKQFKMAAEDEDVMEEGLAKPIVYSEEVEDAIGKVNTMFHQLVHTLLFNNWFDSGLLLEAGSRVLAPVYFEQSTRLEVRNLKKIAKKKLSTSTNINFSCKFKLFFLQLCINYLPSHRRNNIYFDEKCAAR